MSFANGGDPNINPKEGGFENLPQGTYTITGIEDFFSKDEQELPIFKPTKNELKAHCHFTIEDGSKGLPAWSGAKLDYYNLVKALGIGVDTLKAESTTDFLLEVQKRINKAGISTEVKVGPTGWVQKIMVMLPKKGIYRLLFRDAFSLDKTTPVTFQKKDNLFDSDNPNYVVRFMFEIVSDSEGETDYTGTTFIIDVHKPFDGTFNGCPSWKHAKNGGMLAAQRRLLTFMNVFWGEAEDYKWVVDPEESQYGINEAENPIVVIVDKCKNSGKQAMAPLDVTEKGYIKMDLLDLCVTKSVSVTGVKPNIPAGDKVAPWGNTVDSQPVVYTSTVKIHQQLVGTIEGYAFKSGYGPVFDHVKATEDQPYPLTEKGRAWCKENVVPIWNDMNLGEERNFKKLSNAQAAMLVEALKNKLGPIAPPESNTDF